MRADLTPVRRDVRRHALAALAWVGTGCGGSPAGPPPTGGGATVVSLPDPPRSSATGPSPAPSTFQVTTDGELAMPSPISFRVRPLAGPGSMGPSEVAPESDAALAHAQRYLDAHPEGRLRVEVAIDILRTSSGPNAGYASQLAHLVARRLVERGVACTRLEAVGRLARGGDDTPVERVRVLARWGSEPPDGRKDACQP